MCLPVLDLRRYLGEGKLDTLLSLDAFWCLSGACNDLLSQKMSHIKSFTVLSLLIVFLKLEKVVSEVSASQWSEELALGTDEWLISLPMGIVTSRSRCHLTCGPQEPTARFPVSPGSILLPHNSFEAGIQETLLQPWGSQCLPHLLPASDCVSVSGHGASSYKLRR